MKSIWSHIAFFLSFFFFLSALQKRCSICSDALQVLVTWLMQDTRCMVTSPSKKSDCFLVLCISSAGLGRELCKYVPWRYCVETETPPALCRICPHGTARAHVVQRHACRLWINKTCLPTSDISFVTFLQGKTWKKSCQSTTLLTYLVSVACAVNNRSSYLEVWITFCIVLINSHAHTHSPNGIIKVSYTETP